MGYLIPIFMVILIIAGLVTFFVFKSMQKSGPVGDGETPGIGADDDSPLGDTTEHAGEQSGEGTTIGGQDASGAGGTGRPVHSGYAGTTAAGVDATDPDAAAHLQRPGEAEGFQELHFEGHQPPPSPAKVPGARPAGPGQAERETAAEATSPRDAERAEAARPDSERLADREV